MDFFPLRPKVIPRIYAYRLPGVKEHEGELKIGYTTRSVKERVEEQLKTANLRYEIVLDESAMREDGSVFTDKEIHRYLVRRGVRNSGGEWFACDVETLKAAILAVRNRQENVENRTKTFAMRPEQVEAVERTMAYFRRFKAENPDKTPHFLWNAKMRFGKTFAAYQLAKKMGWKKILILTFKPAVESAWEEDLKTHVDFEGWQFVAKDALSIEEADPLRPIVCFGSFQDYLGRNEAGGIKAANEWVHTTHWDCVVFDEYHFGSWRERAKELFEAEKEEKDFVEGEAAKLLDENEDEIEEIMPITTDHYLYLSGTPFRAIATGEFIEEQIFNWTYTDEQKAKESWQGPDNPYAMLPRMVMMTYQLPEEIRSIAEGGEFDEFDLNEFFKAEGEEDEARFVYEEYVQKWLDLIRGAYLPTSVDQLKLGGRKKPPLPFSDARLLEILTHTFWFLPNVSACYAMRNLMKKRHNTFYHDYKIVVAAGQKAGIGVKALQPVLDAMDDPLETKTITLSCGKLTTGVSVKPWSGIFMLRNLTSPETYFQAAFRVQTPWTVKNPDGKSPNEELILKNECYVFDFAPNRALRQVADYSAGLDTGTSDPEKKVADLIHFLPVLAYDGSAMKQINAQEVLDMAMSGTTATLLARRWESALLVNVDNATLKRLLDNERALEALMKIEGFRSLNQDIETIINKSESIKKLKKAASERELTKQEKKELTEEEKEYRKKRKEIQEKLIKFATRIPIFMYLTDYREKTLKDVITRLEPTLFKRVTGLDVKDFELLISLDLFNNALMNDAVYKFKRYEDASLEYLGINRHKGEDVGGYDTVITVEEYKRL